MCLFLVKEVPTGVSFLLFCCVESAAWCLYQSTADNPHASFMATMKTLVDKYPGGYEEWEKQNATRIAQAAQAAGAGPVFNEAMNEN